MISKATQKARREEVARHIATWQSRLLLDHWDVLPALAAANKEGNDSTFADIASRNRYREARMTVYPFLWESPDGADPAYREATIVHELSHVIAAPLEDVVDSLLAGKLVTKEQYADALEQVTEHIAKVVVRAYRD
jgi:hypothetical protein